ncbi:hypothetical protein JUJ52_11105 [Virgibacillus sp. AGTR]|uniref:hypothetical protein n=1 Tax=unclassified Virgibacillus TaxID=2620237 RepID=UPI000EF54385|nr:MULTISPECIES: hypothetical protein [unclassified Virgibacillus]MCC2250509.1 hypothetical protein [Virgibacillus sp. AGTR]QRZ18297.1 hypothetical protein JUJ52_00595 [Virgibacillus sp. AGTR]
MEKQKDLKLAQFMGILFIIIGVIGFIIIMASFDYAEYGELKNDSYLLEDDEIRLQVMKDDLTSTWVAGIATLIINVAIGTVLITLGKIVSLLEDIKKIKQSESVAGDQSN